jgi:TolA-binding protein
LFKSVISLFLFFITFSYAAEVSVFGAGDLNSPEPYGLTPTEKVIVNNKKSLQKTEKKVNKFDSQIRQINETLNGLESIVEGESQKLNKFSREFSQVQSQSEFDREKINENIEALKSLQVQIEQNTQNIATLKESMDQLVETMNKINKEYVSRNDFKDLLKEIDKKTVVKKSTKPAVPKKSKANLMKDVRVWFKKDHFTKAIPVIEYLIAQNYRPAENNYYLGEINYYRKNYKDALHYFKTSMMLYDKAKWLPKLLLHSAISFEELGDTQNAQSFYSTLVDIYPDSSEAKEASKKIK